MNRHPLDPRKLALARHLRRTMTDAEKRLWSRLRDGRLDGLTFRRQVPMGRYVADFLTHHARLVVEVDGSQHLERQAAVRDAARDAWFASQGYRVLRFSNVEVLSNTEGVLWAIGEAAGLWGGTADRDHRGPPTLPSPTRGEEAPGSRRSAPLRRGASA